MQRKELKIGQPAPGFRLADQDGIEVSIGTFRGRWVVLYFYPKDDTPGCTTEACEFTDGIETFGGLDAVVLGCSPDSPERHRKFIAKHRLKVRLLSDPGHEVMAAYGAWGEKNMYGKVVEGVIRSTVIIDPEGRVAHHWKQVKAAGHADKVREKLEELQS
jgi:peroxiredoxin Q/BCP